VTDRAVGPIYAIDVGTFRDANADGIGDLQGVVASLDHVERLGARAIWLLPFYPSPNRDNGYDVADYYGVDARFGSFGDFVDLIAETRRRNVRVIIDLVINHTSDQHPWFRAARAHPDGPFRDYYTWRDEPPSLTDQSMQVFPDRVPGSWTWDEAVGAFFFHQFYPFQPTLNHRNPAVADEVRRMVNFWLELGVSGFRVDAAGHIGEPDLEPGSDEAIEIVRRYRSFVDGRNADAVLLGEADLPADRLGRLLGEDRLQLLFDFIGNANLYLAFTRRSAEPIARAYASHGPPPANGGWIHFLRNLDEVDLERLTDDERREVMEELAPEPRMRIFKRGIRRRLAPMLDGDMSRLRLAFSILCALPGVPMIVYGDEIGMGDDQSQPEREAVRTAMQWSSSRAAGFSEAPDPLLRVPIISDARYGPETVNVADQERDPDSLLSFVRAALALRLEHQQLLVGPATVETLADGRVLSTCAARDGEQLMTVHNLGDRSASFDAPWAGAEAAVLFGHVGGGEGRAVLEPYGFCWMRLARA
jgi:maltose alpha-D-glucosyltransferase/alpha-amylase